MTPIVLLPGMMCDARLFAPQIAALSARHPVMTAPIGDHDSVGALADAVLTVAPPEFALAGLSMGGIVAMEMVRRRPERITRLALLDTNPLAEADEMRARRGPQIRAAEQGHLRAVMRDEMKPGYLAEGPNRAALMDLCMDMAEALGPAVFVNQSRALMDRPDQQATLRAYRRPALVMCGRDDRLCPVDRHRLMHELLPAASLDIVPDAGHLPTLENPGYTTGALLRWMEE